MKYNKPKVLISKCLEFDACRYDGALITNKYIKKLKKYIDFITVCPEVEIGLGIPRSPIHLINNKNKFTLYQPSTKKDLGEKMLNFSKKFINSLDNIDGILLKSKSPSCALKTSKQYPNIDSKQSFKQGPGLFTQQLINNYEYIPKEEETRLNDFFLREHFYTSIFIIADFKKINSFKKLYNYHAKHKLLFMTYNQLKLKTLGKIAANHEGLNFDLVRKKYYNLLLKLLYRRPKYTSHINTQMHAFGYYKKHLSKSEKQYFITLLTQFKQKKISVSNLNNILSSWNIRFENDYLLNQSYFKPYPDDLIESNSSRMQ